MGEFDNNRDENRIGQQEKGEKPAFGQLGEKGQQGQQESGQDRQNPAQPEELAGTETRPGQQFGETPGETGQQGRDFAKDGQGATGDTSRQQQQGQEQGRSKGEQGTDRQDDGGQQR